MVKVTFEAVSATAYSKKLETPIKYAVEYDAYVDYAELAAANDTLTHDEQVKARNDQRKSNARQKALTAALEAAGFEKPTIENDPQLRLKRMYEVFVANGDSHEVARKAASDALKLEWDTE